MNRLFNAQNSNMGRSVDIVFTSETEYKFLDRFTQEEITFSEAYKGNAFRVVPFPQAGRETRYGNYDLVSHTENGLTLQLKTRRIRLYDPFGDYSSGDGKLIDYTPIDYWAAHFKEGSPAFTLEFTNNSLNIKTLWDLSYAIIKRTDIDEEDGGLSFSLVDNRGISQGTTGEEFDMIMRASMSRPYKNNLGIGMETYITRGTQGTTTENSPFFIKFEYESVHWYKYILGNALAYFGDDHTYYSGDYKEDIGLVTPKFVSTQDVTQNITRSQGYADIDLLNIYKGAVPAEDLIVNSSSALWIKQVSILNITTQPILRVKFDTMGSASTRKAALILSGTDFNNKVSFTSTINLTLISI